MKRLLATIILVSLTSANSRAEVLTLLPVADSFVDALVPDTAFPTGHLEAAMTGPVGELATELTFLYAQFQLPDGLTGQDIASINSVNFRVRRASNATPPLNLTYYVYAVHDGIDIDSADTYTWNESVGFDPTHNEVRFPPDPDEISYYTDPAESAFIGGLDTTSSGPVTRPFGFYADALQSATALQNRADAILQDTDGRITLYMKVRPNFDTTPLQMFASLENPDLIPAPELIIDYVPGSGAPDGDFNEDGSVDAADYVVWRKNSGTEIEYNEWTTNFGVTGGAGGTQFGSVVPEPTTLTFVIIAWLFVGSGRRGPVGK